MCHPLGNFPSFRTLLAIGCVVLGLGISQECAGQTTKPTKTTKAPGPRLSARELAFVKTIERKLATKLNSKENPGDKNTYYVLWFQEIAAANAAGASSDGLMDSITLSTRTNQKSDTQVVQGKREAALAVAVFLSSANAAVAELRSPRLDAMAQQTQVGGQKQWNFRAFATEQEAKKFQEEVEASQSRRR